VAAHVLLTSLLGPPCNDSALSMKAMTSSQMRETSSIWYGCRIITQRLREAFSDL